MEGLDGHANEDFKGLMAVSGVVFSDFSAENGEENRKWFALALTFLVRIFWWLK